MKIRPGILRSKKEEKTTTADFDDLGFGTKIGRSVDRLINHDGSFNIERRGNQGGNLYQSLVETSWGRFWLLVVGFYFLVNILFAVLYSLAGIEHLQGIDPNASFGERFLYAFFFSVQTFTTVGYGAIHPESVPTNLIATFDALVGLLSFALVTGLFFARFSKPRAQILFSEQALITPHNEGMSFQFRIANRRHTKILNVTAKVTMTWLERDGSNGIRRFTALPLERKQIYMFPLNWTLVHPINERSPLYGKRMEMLEEMQVEFLALIEGYDETFAQTVHSSNSYTWRELVWNRKFSPMYYDGADGKTILELDEIHSTHQLEEEE